MAWHTWLIYLVATVGLSLTPGPNSLLVLTHGALHGHRRTLWTVAGGALGFVAVIALSMLGIGALLQTSASALLVLKWVGGAYLVWLGLKMLRKRAGISIGLVQSWEEIAGPRLAGRAQAVVGARARTPHGSQSQA